MKNIVKRATLLAQSRIASEDVGNADPRAMQVAIAAWDCFTRVGPAEGERAIAQAIVYLACAPKSNAVYTAFKAALADARERPDYDVPVHLRNAMLVLLDAGVSKSSVPNSNKVMKLLCANKVGLLTMFFICRKFPVQL